MQKEAAEDIANQPSRNDLEFNRADKAEDPKATASSQEAKKEQEEEKKEVRPIGSPEDAMMKLQQAQTYNRAGANIIERSNEMVGSMLDTRV
jgi:hypothetical protein